MKKIKRLTSFIVLAAVLTACNNGTAMTNGSTGSSGTNGKGTINTSAAAGTTSAQSSPVSNVTTAAQTAPSGLAPVESRKPNTTYQPAFPGQTRSPGVKTETAFKTEIITEGLAKPWSVKELPNGRLVVTEKQGALRIVTPEGTVSNPITGFPNLESGGQGGLLDVLPALDFQESRILYFTLSEKTGEGSLTAVGKGRLSEDETKLETFTIIYRAIPYFRGSAHFGSRLVFDDEGNLFVSTGERQSNATRNKAQTLDNGYGKIIHITTEGKPVETNPFNGQDGVLPEIYSYGHRNPQGLAIHPESGEIWISEMGPRGGDELNVIMAGKNYGWPVISYGIEYTGQKIGDGLTAKEGMEQPVYYWDPVMAPSGMTFYDSDVIPEWKDNLFIGGLAGTHIARIVLDGHKVVGEERLLIEERQRFRDITQSRDGALYAVTDSGRLYRIGK